MKKTLLLSLALGLVFTTVMYIHSYQPTYKKEKIILSPIKRTTKFVKGALELGGALPIAAGIWIGSMYISRPAVNFLATKGKLGLLVGLTLNGSAYLYGSCGGLTAGIVLAFQGIHDLDTATAGVEINYIKNK